MLFNRELFAAFLVGTAHISVSGATFNDAKALAIKPRHFIAPDKDGALLFPSSSSISRPAKHDSGASRRLQSIGFGGDTETTGSGGDTETTNASDEVNYRASYLSRFQHLVDPVCEGPNPTIAVFCQGTLTPVSISDSTIECSSLTNSDGWEGIMCSNTCGSASGDTSCEDVFLESENIGGDRFGEIVFQCEGADIADVDAYMHYVGGDDGSCIAQTTTSESVPSRNFHVAQLGVQCSEDDTFLFDDTFFECDVYSSTANIEGMYTCLAGENCAGEDCTTSFRDMYVEADRENFLQCVESVSGAAVPTKTSEIESGPVAAGHYTAVFQARWQLLVDLETCRGEFAPKRISCTNGNIELEGPLVGDVDCTMINDSELECTDGAAATFVNEFSGVRFSCKSEDEVPQAMVEYMSGEAFCEGTEDNSVVHLLQLGFECSDSDGDFEIFDDYLLECGQGNIHSDVGGRYTCAAGAAFVSSTREETPTGVAKISTDFRWGAGSFESCFTRTTVEPTGTTTAKPQTPVPAPVPVPTTPTTANTPSPPAESTVEAVPGTTYSVEYKARFKRVIDDGCEGPSKDTIFIVCPKGKLEILDTHDSVVCLPATDTTDGEGQVTICDTTCRGGACDDVYVDRKSYWVLGIWVLDADLYAEVTYSCSAEDDVNGVDTLYFLLGSEDSGEEGSCTGEGTGNGQNLVFGELNIMCDTPEGSVFVNEDAYTECDFARSWDINGAYTCFDGSFCRDSACAVTYDDLYVFADHHRFRECITTDNGSGVPIPEVEVDREDVAPGQYSARFRVGSGYWYDEENCSGSKTGMKIECIDGTINLVEGSLDKSCSATSESTVECIETETSIINEHVDVAVYDCTSLNGVPKTKVEYYSANMECESTSAERGRRWLNMGVLCGDAGGGESYSSWDYFFECGKDNKFGEITEDLLFACSGQADIPSDSAGSIFTIPKVDMMTDHRWEYSSTDSCYSFKPTSKSLVTHDFVKAAMVEAKQSAGGSQRLLLPSFTNPISSAIPGASRTLPTLALFFLAIFLV